MSTYRYEIKMPGDGWRLLFEENRSFCAGFLAARRESPGPRLAARVVRSSDGKVVDEIGEKTEVDIGMIAGHPTAEQYEAAGNRALAIAAKIRERESRARR